MAINLRTVLLGGLGLAIVGGLLVTVLRPSPIPVDLYEIETGTLTVTVNVEGRTRIREVFEISSPIAGTLQRMPYEEGDMVEAGKSVVARVEPIAAPLLDARSRAEATAVLREAEAAVRLADAEVSRTQANMNFARLQFERTQALVNSQAISLTRLEDASLRLSVADAAVISAEAAAAMARATLERAQATLAEPGGPNEGADCCVDLFAPADGVVLWQASRSTRTVAPSEKLLTIGDPRDLEIVVDLLSADATRLQVGARALVDRWGGTEPLDAVVTLIEPRATTVVSALGIEEQRVEALLDITTGSEVWQGLGDGFAVFVLIEEWSEEDVLLVPLSALFRRNGDWFAFVESGGLAEQRGIEIGRRDGRHAVVVSGLEAGERVIAHPPDSITEGVQVTERVIER